MDTISTYTMPHLPEMSDRLWHAYCALPRDATGELPSHRELERQFDLSPGTLSRAVRGERTNQTRRIFKAICAAVRASEHWIEFGGADAPVATEVVPPRPGLDWKRYGELPGWRESVAIALRDATQRVPKEAFLAGAELPVYRHVDRITPELAIAAAAFAWETSTPTEQTTYSTKQASRASAGGHPSSKQLRASTIQTRPVAK